MNRSPSSLSCSKCQTATERRTIAWNVTSNEIGLLSLVMLAVAPVSVTAEKVTTAGAWLMSAELWAFEIAAATFAASARTVTDRRIDRYTPTPMPIIANPIAIDTSNSISVKPERERIITICPRPSL